MWFSISLPVPGSQKAFSAPPLLPVPKQKFWDHFYKPNISQKCWNRHYFSDYHFWDSKHLRDCRQQDNQSNRPAAPSSPLPLQPLLQAELLLLSADTRCCSFAQELEWMERNANLQISKEILRNQCEKVTQQTWRDWRSRWRNWRKGVRGPQWPNQIFKIV